MWTKAEELLEQNYKYSTFSGNNLRYQLVVDLDYVTCCLFCGVTKRTGLDWDSSQRTECMDNFLSEVKGDQSGLEYYVLPHQIGDLGTFVIGVNNESTTKRERSVLLKIIKQRMAEVFLWIAPRIVDRMTEKD